MFSWLTGWPTRGSQTGSIEQCRAYQGFPPRGKERATRKKDGPGNDILAQSHKNPLVTHRVKIRAFNRPDTHRSRCSCSGYILAGRRVLLRSARQQLAEKAASSYACSSPSILNPWKVERDTRFNFVKGFDDSSLFKIWFLFHLL
jgi:hypothetical protein